MLDAPPLLRVIFVRQLLVPGIALNVLFGMTPVRHTAFVAGTLLGYLPLNVAFSLVGSGLGKETLAESLTQILFALALISVLAWSMWKVFAKRRTK